MFAAVSGGEVVGVAGFDGRQARTVFGRLDWRGKALGSWLMRAIEDLAAEMGCSELSLLSSIAAQPFYARLGYEPLQDVFWKYRSLTYKRSGWLIGAGSSLQEGLRDRAPASMVAVTTAHILESLMDTPAETPERQAFYARINKQNMTALWTVMNALITPEPKSQCVAALWRFEDIRAAMLEAGSLISAKEAERRVLILENPGLRGCSKVTTALYAGVQLVMPHEVAPAHRHSQSALRFVIEGKGAFTTVDGERTYMSPGDFVITPSMAWHDHGNESEDPMFWLDGLDIPLVQFLDASFVERHPDEQQPITKPIGHSGAQYGANLLPIDHRRGAPTSPIFNYPYARTREALNQLARASACDPCHGIKLRYTNPVTGDHAMPTMATFIQLLPSGFKSNPYRSTDATVFCITEGRGRTRIGDESLAWGPKDIFVVPSWHKVVHEAIDGECVLFSFSDRVVQEKLGIWREQRGNF